MGNTSHLSFGRYVFYLAQVAQAARVCRSQAFVCSTHHMHNTLAKDVAVAGSACSCDRIAPADIGPRFGRWYLRVLSRPSGEKCEPRLPF